MVPVYVRKHRVLFTRVQLCKYIHMQNINCTKKREFTHVYITNKAYKRTKTYTSLHLYTHRRLAALTKSLTQTSIYT
jgi:hypothetical protein